MEVGGDLYEIDTEAEASVEASAEPAAATEEAPTSVSSPSSSSASTAQTAVSTTAASHRVPSIRFLGKEGWALLLSGQKPGAPQLEELPPMYGRPKFSEDEMDALILGGANLAPQLVAFSGGAKFR